MNKYLSIITSLVVLIAFSTQVKAQPRVHENVPTDSIRLSDPFVFADKKTKTYYMTGTGGMLWKSKNLKTWTGPYRVAKTDPK